MDLREYEKSQNEAIRRVDRQVALERYGPLAPWIPRAEWAAAVLAGGAFVLNETVFLPWGHETDWLLVAIGAPFLAGLAHSLAGAVLRAILRRSH